MPSRLSIPWGATAIPALLATVQSLPSMAAVYTAHCQFNDQPPMACVVHAKPVPFGWTIQWQDGVGVSSALWGMAAPFGMPAVAFGGDPALTSKSSCAMPMATGFGSNSCLETAVQHSLPF